MNNRSKYTAAALFAFIACATGVAGAQCPQCGRSDCHGRTGHQQASPYYLPPDDSSPYPSQDSRPYRPQPQSGVPQAGPVDSSQIADPSADVLSPSDLAAFDARALPQGGAGRLASTDITSPLSTAPNMIGDFFAGGADLFSSTAGMINQPAAVVPVAGGDRRHKISENNNPFPQDRFYYSYNFFNNALITADADDLGLYRHAFGAEKTFGGGMLSLEARLLFATGLNSTQRVGPAGTVDNKGTEFGNLWLSGKALLYRDRFTTVGTGLGVTLPTADDAILLDNAGNVNLVVENDSVHLQPYLGVMHTPSSRAWSIFFVQADFDANGNEVDFRGNTVAGNVDGIYQDQNLLYLDASFGYWLYRDTCRNSSRILRGLAPIVELHYSTTMNDSDIVQNPDAPANATLTAGDFVTNVAGRMDVLNITGALRFQLGGMSYLTVAGVAPLRNGDDQIFDSEVSTQFVRLF